MKLSDFGIAKQMVEETMAQTMVGTMRYMSPERLKGETYRASSDMWSLGLMLIELWTGEYPFPFAETPIDLMEEVTTISYEELLDDIDYPRELNEVGYM